MAVRTVTMQVEGDDVEHMSVDEVCMYGDVLSDETDPETEGESDE